MSTARRLLLVALGGAGFAPTPTPLTLTELTADTVGGHSEPQWPKAWGHNGYTYYGGIDGTNGDVGILAVEDANVANNSWTVLFPALGGEGTADLHDDSAVIVLPDSGKLLTWTCRHADSSVRQRVSVSALASDPLLGDGFTSTTNIDFGTLHDYPVLLILNDTLYGFVREIPTGSVDAHLRFMTTTDLSAATGWGTNTDLYNNPGKTTYWQITSDADRIHVLTFDDNEASAPGGLNDLKHFTMDAAGDLFQTDGSAIVAGLPLEPGDIDTIPSTGGHHLWNLDLYGGNPATVVTAYPDGWPPGDAELRRIVWNGSTWLVTTIDTTTGSGLSWGVALHPDDKDRVFGVRDSGDRDLVEYRYSGGWDAGTVLDAGASADEWVFPVEVRNSGRVKVIALKGEYNSYLDWALSVWGMVED